MIVNEEFWQRDDETREELFKINSEQLQNEKQFRDGQQMESVSNHGSYIQKAQKLSFDNTQKYDNHDLEKRGKLRTERIEWNKKLQEMDNICNDIKENFNALKESMSALNAEISQIVEETKVASSEAEDKKKGKGKAKGKSKSKISKPSTDIKLPQNIPKLLEQCQNVEQNVPKWVYGNKLDKCNELLNTLIYDIIVQSNNEFAELIDHKKNVSGIEEETFKECTDKYMNFCLAIFEQINVLKEWKEMGSWSEQFHQEQNKLNGVIVESTFIKLQSLIPMNKQQKLSEDVKVTENEKINPEETDHANDNHESSEKEEIALDTIVSYLNEIEFVGDLKDEIKIKDDYKIKLSVDYVTYVTEIEQWLKNKQEQQAKEEEEEAEDTK